MALALDFWNSFFYFLEQLFSNFLEQFVLFSGTVVFDYWSSFFWITGNVFFDYWSSFFWITGNVVVFVFTGIIYFFFQTFPGGVGRRPWGPSPTNPVYAYMYMIGPNFNQFWAKYQPAHFLLDEIRNSRKTNHVFSIDKNLLSIDKFVQSDVLKIISILFTKK